MVGRGWGGGSGLGPIPGRMPTIRQRPGRTSHLELDTLTRDLLTAASHAERAAQHVIDTDRARSEHHTELDTTREKETNT